MLQRKRWGMGTYPREAREKCSKANPRQGAAPKSVTSSRVGRQAVSKNLRVLVVLRRSGHYQRAAFFSVNVAAAPECLVRKLLADRRELHVLNPAVEKQRLLPSLHVLQRFRRFTDRSQIGAIQRPDPRCLAGQQNDGLRFVSRLNRLELRRLGQLRLIHRDSYLIDGSDDARRTTPAIRRHHLEAVLHREERLDRDDNPRPL